MNFLNLEINQKNYIKIIILSILIVTLILVLYYIELLVPKKIILESTTTVADFNEQEDLVVHIDILSSSSKKVEIAGYAYLTDDEVFTVDCSYVLRNKESGKMYLLKTRYEKNVNVPEVYPYAGMHTRFLTLGIEKGNYDICVLYKNNENNIFKNTGINVEI